ncbi:MAG: sulfotransferase family protein [Pikeienuella sp.]
MSKFPGVWVSESGRLAYRVLPKCACSTIGQIMYYGDSKTYFDGDIHDADHGLLKWDQDHNHDRIRAAVEDNDAFTFTCVRNPYSRVLSAFFDKVCGIQRNGKRYRGNMVPMLTKRYGVEVDGDFDQIKSFRRFLLFVRDTIRYRKPMFPDIHWIAMANHIGYSAKNGMKFDYIFATEHFNDGMKHVLSQAPLVHEVDVDAMPRFNESEGHGPKRAHPVEDYFDDLSIYIMHDIYKKDFQLFKYDQEPGRGGPKKDIDPEEVYARLMKNVNKPAE